MTLVTDLLKSHQVGDKIEAAVVDFALVKLCEMLAPLLPHGIALAILSSLANVIGLDFQTN